MTSTQLIGSWSRLSRIACAACCACVASLTAPWHPAQAEIRLVSPLPAAPDPEFCTATLATDEDKPVRCDVPSLPCGPVAANKLPAGSKVGADLDGDGRADAALINRRGGDPGASYSAIYRGTPKGFVLSDYHEISYAIGPALPRVVVPMKGAAPIIEDGSDEPLVKGRSLSERRLRRWNGERFVTLLRYCKNRQLIEQGRPPVVAGQRVIGIDLNNDGIKELVLQGQGRPRVFLLAKDGTSIAEDADLTQSYRQNTPAQKQAVLLRDKAKTLMNKATQLPRAVTMLNRARLMAPYDIDIALALADGVLRMKHASEAIPLLEQTQQLDAKRAEPHCVLARAYEQTGEREKEKITLQSCLGHSPSTEYKTAAEQRMQVLSN